MNPYTDLDQNQPRICVMMIMMTRRRMMVMMTIDVSRLKMGSVTAMEVAKPSRSPN